MGKTFVAGLLFIAAAVVTIIVGNALNLEIDSAFFGLAVGAILAFVGDKSSAFGRVGAFAVGVIVTMAGYLVRILALNESLLGQIIFAVIVGLLITVICAITVGRLPLWAGFLGAAFVIGSYEANFLEAPQDITTNLFTNVSVSLVPMAVAFLFGIFLKPELIGVSSKDDAGIDRAESKVMNEPTQKSEV